MQSACDDDLVFAFMWPDSSVNRNLLCCYGKVEALHLLASRSHQGTGHTLRHPESASLPAHACIIPHQSSAGSTFVLAAFTDVPGSDSILQFTKVTGMLGTCSF